MNPVAIAALTGHDVRTLYENYAGLVNPPKLPDLLPPLNPVLPPVSELILRFLAQISLNKFLMVGMIDISTTSY
jgi:hypothetical protein